MHKVLAAGERPFEELVSGDTPFGLATNFTGYARDEMPNDAQVLLYANVATKRVRGAMAREAAKLDYGVATYWYGFPGAGGSSKGVQPPVAAGDVLRRRLRDYGCMWWAHGVRSKEKIFNIQTGFYGLSFDYGALALRKMGSISSFVTEAAVL